MQPTIPLPRKPNLALDGAIPRHWFGGSAVATQIANGVNLLFPHGERFFVRSVHRYLDDPAAALDPALREQVRGFFGQEGRHAAAHERFFAVMREQGYEIDGFLARYAALSRWLEARTPAVLNLASTAAAEHFTAIMAEGALREEMFASADPAMRALLLWHAAEEIEHKAVAFDVLRAVDPRYRVRIAGLLIATTTLVGFWAAATVMLWRQDGLDVPAAMCELGRLRRWRRAALAAAGASAGEQRARTGPIARKVFLRGIRQYLRPGFHPSDNDTDALARDYLAAAGFEPA